MAPILGGKKTEMSDQSRRGSIMSRLYLQLRRKLGNPARTDSVFSTDYTKDSDGDSDCVPTMDELHKTDAVPEDNNKQQTKSSCNVPKEPKKKIEKIITFEVIDEGRNDDIDSFVIIDYGQVCDPSEEGQGPSEDSQMQKYLQSLNNLRRDSGFDTADLITVKPINEGGEGKNRYKATFFTENVDTTAATDNQMFLQVIGETGETNKLEIKFQDLKQERHDERDKHTCMIETTDIDDISSIRLVHINQGNGLYRWYLGSVTLKTRNNATIFHCNQWIEQESGELTIEMRSGPSETTGSCNMTFIPSKDGDMSHSLRSIGDLKRGLDEGSAAYKLLCRAEEIQNSKKFQEKKEKSRQYLLSVNLLDEYFEERMEEMAIDMAEREDERNVDMMQFERAGLPPEEQAEIKKLDETNNLCYKYLRDHGNMWQYDPDKIHPCMKARLYRRFDTFDKDSDGVMTIDEVLTWADRMRSVCDTEDYEVEYIRESLKGYFTMYGLGDDGLCRENWVEAHVTMGEAAKEREKQGDPIPMKCMANAYFDVIDEDDNGILDMKELKNMMNVFRVPEEAAYTFFEAADIDGDGELVDEEMHKLFYRFWFGEYDSELDGIFAYKY